MDATSTQELESLQQAATRQENYVVHWRSAFGLVVIEVRGEEAFVNGDKVIPASEQKREI